MFEYVQDANLVWNGRLQKRTKTEGIVIHHLAGSNRTVKQVHDDEIKSRGWIGIGYNFYVRKDGSVWKGRGLEYIGAHSGRKVNRSAEEWAAAANNNSRTVGIGFEGYYHPWDGGTPDKVMPLAQFDAGVRLIKDIQQHYGGGLYIKGHKQMPATATACPGDYFPFEKMLNAVEGQNTPNAVEGQGTNAMPAPAEKSYIVKQGDTLYAIARANGMTLTKLLSYNPQIKNPKMINVGDVIMLTGSGVTLNRVLRLKTPLMKGDDVKTIQTLLNGQIDADLSVDGKYGAKTASAVRRMQELKGIKKDGIVGEETAGALGLVWNG